MSNDYGLSKDVRGMIIYLTVTHFINLLDFFYRIGYNIVVLIKCVGIFISTIF